MRNYTLQMSNMRKAIADLEAADKLLAPHLGPVTVSRCHIRKCIELLERGLEALEVKHEDS